MKKIALFLLPVLLLAACIPPVPPPTIADTPTVQPTPTAGPAAPISPPATKSPLPSSTLFDTAWDDRSPFTSGLIAEASDAATRLPGATVYHMDISLADDLQSLQGREELRYTNNEDVALSAVHLRLFPNTGAGRSVVSHLTVNGETVTPRYKLQDSDMIVPLAPPLAPGQSVVLGMDFAVQVPTDAGRNYGTFALLDDILALAHFYPMMAVYDDEGWNVEIAPEIGDVVYADTSFYLVRVRAPLSQTLIASGFELSRTEEQGRQVVVFAAGPMRDFYLVSSARYQRQQQQVGETMVNAYAPPALASENALALRYATQALAAYNARFGLYPFRELDVVGTPTTAGGVEYPGVIAIALSLYDPGQRFFESATAHEVAHQWWYSVVGNDQVDEPWLDESLTQYATLQYWRDVYGEAAYRRARRVMQQRWDRVDDADIPLDLPVSAFNGATYSGIIYGRGPLFFEALAKAMGQDTFDAFLREYYRSLQWGISTTPEFERMAEQACACDLGELWQQWVEPQP